MRSYYRVLLFNLAVTLPLTVAILLNRVKNTPAAVLLVEVALCVANFVITWQFVRQRGTSSLETRKWRFVIWCAWTMGPLITAMLPTSVAMLIIRRDFEVFIVFCVLITTAVFSFHKVRGS
jgi:hypothetical protein